jgi:hypothetical protein
MTTTRPEKWSARISVLSTRKVKIPSTVPIREGNLGKTARRLQNIPFFFMREEELLMNQSNSQDRDGFHVRVSQFILPADTSNLDPKIKRAVTICNLFVNYQYSISDVVRVLDEDRGNVVLVLLKKGILRERRVRQRIPPEGIERRKTVLSANLPLRSPK